MEISIALSLAACLVLLGNHLSRVAAERHRKRISEPGTSRMRCADDQSSMSAYRASASALPDAPVQSTQGGSSAG